MFFGVVMTAVFYNLGTGDAGIQTRQGLLFFIATMNAFGAINGSQSTFSIERPIFIRERLSKSYTASAYFWGKCCAELPFLLIFPFIFVTIVYFSVGLNSDPNKYAICLGINMMVWLAGSGYGLVISTFIPRLEVAMAMTPILVIPLMVMAGFFVNQNNIPYFLYEFEYISPFKYGYQAMVQNEFMGETITGCGINFDQVCDPLGENGFNESIGLSIGVLGILAVAWRIIAYWGLIKVSTPQKPKIQKEFSRQIKN